MSGAAVEIQLIAALTAAACALPGVFLVLRKMAMMSDAVSHAVLPGIVIGFFLTHDLGSPLMIVAAAAAGVLTVWLVEFIYSSGNLREDAAIGLVFPFLFSIGVVLISRYAADVHLDLDAVLMGEIAFAPFDRITVAGRDWGPRGVWLLGSILAANLLLIGSFYKELKLASFDAGLASVMGFAPTAIHYAFMTTVSVTVVGAFDVVGSILVIALFVAPPATAYLLTDHLPRMLFLSVVVGAASAVAGYWVAYLVDGSIGGAMAAMCGVSFFVAYIGAPGRGWIARWRRRRRQRLQFRFSLLLVHLYHHRSDPDQLSECRLDELHEHMTWDRGLTVDIVRKAERAGLVYHDAGFIQLTERGAQRARRELQRT